jgi:uncharacterized protein
MLVNSSKMGSFLLGATLALGFALSAYMVSAAMVKMRQANIIKVKGYAQTQIKSDAGLWRGELTVRAPDLAAGYKEMDINRVKVREMIEKLGFTKETTIDFLPVAIDTRYKLDEKNVRTNVIFGYVLSQTVEIQSHQIDMIQTVSKAASDLIREGIEFRSGRPIFTFSGIEKIKLDLLAEATRNAYDRARTLAENSGGKVGALCSASQGVFQITPLNSTDVSDTGEYDTSTIDKTVKAVVTLEFHVEK